MVPIVQDSETRRVPASYFMGTGGNASAISFQAHGSLNNSHTGKLVMNMGGQARLAQRSTATAGIAGRWKILMEPPVAPRQAEFQLKFLYGESPADGQTFSIWGQTFTFRDTATETYDIQIGSDDADTSSNIFLKFNTLGGYILIQVNNETVSDGRIYTLRAGQYFPGESGNALNFSSGTGAFTLVGQTLTGKNNDLDNVGKTLFTVSKYSNGNSYTHDITLGHVLHDPTSAYGIRYGNYRWPATAAYMLGNLHLYLAADTSFQSNFSHDWNNDTLFEIKEADVPTDPQQNVSVTANPYSPVSVSIDTVQEPVIPQPGFVIHPLLGVLKSVGGNTAEIDNGRMFRVRLATDSEPVVFDAGIPVTLENRLLVPTNNGEVRRELIETSNDGYFANGIFCALEEASPGSDVLVEWIKLIGH